MHDIVKNSTETHVVAGIDKTGWSERETIIDSKTGWISQGTGDL